MKRIAIVLLSVLLVNSGHGQSILHKIDTVRMSGYLYSVQSKKNFGQKNIDYPISVFFSNERISKNKIYYKHLFETDRNRDSLFFVCPGPELLTLNDLFFDKRLPTSQPFNFYSNEAIVKKDKKYVYRLFKLNEAIVLKTNMVEKELIHVIPYEQYKFSKTSIPVFILYGNDTATSQPIN